MLMWTPLVLGLLGAIADVTQIYTLDAHVWHVASDTARRLSVEELTEASAAEFARAALPEALRAASTITAVDAGEGGDVTVTISTPTSAMSLIGLYSAVLDGNVVATVSMTREGAQTIDFTKLTDGVGAGAPAGGA